MSNGHRTSAIARPARDLTRVSSRAGHDRAGDAKGDHTRIGDLTRPIRADRQLVTRPGHRWMLAGFGFAVVGALLAALFVLPVQAWRRQGDETRVKLAELDVLTRTNGPLQAEVNRLATTEGARDAARDELSMVDQGEERVSILPPVDVGALPLPGGWPYDALAQIVGVRSQPPATPATPATESTAGSSP